MQVSIFVRKGVFCILIMQDGSIKRKIVEEIKDEHICSSMYESLIHAMGYSLRYVKAYLEEHPDIENVIFEINNSHVRQWVYQCYAKDRYQDSFQKMFRQLQEIPMKYSIIVSDNPLASMYAYKKYVSGKEKLSGLKID